jgi:hypothetical protein
MNKARFTLRYLFGGLFAVLCVSMSCSPGANTVAAQNQQNQKTGKESTDVVQRVVSAADISGPDGITYPDFTYAGVPGGIPQVKVVAKLEEFGGRTGADIADALENGARAVAKRGGGALLIGPGIYYLDRPMLITGSRVVIRGAGHGRTKIIFRWEPQPGSVDFIGLEEGMRISPNRPIIAAAWNASANNKVEKSIKRLAFEINGSQAGEVRGGEGPWFTVTQDNRKTAAQWRDGANTLRVVAEYHDGSKAEKTLSVVVDKADQTLIAAAPTETAIQFADPTAGQVDWAQGDLAAMPRRGDKHLEFKQAQRFAAGDILKIVWPGAGWGGPPLVTVSGTQGNRVLLVEPIRVNMPSVSNVRRLQMIRHSGIEDLTLEQSSKHWTNLLGFSGDYACWVRGVKLVNAGRFPIAGGTKNFEVRDTIVDGAQFHFGVGGGTGYFGFSSAFDCLMDNVQTSRLRHAPNLQFGAQGCVIRNSTFEDSDLQFHRDATWDNLIENCTVRSRGSNKSYGSYGSAMTATTSPHDASLGARNVIWNNDFESQTFYKGGSAVAIVGGEMQGWIIAYNRFVHDVGVAVNAGKSPHDVLFLRNSFAVKQPAGVAITGDVSRLRLVDNTFTGFSAKELLPNGATAAENRSNSMQEVFAAGARPTAPVPSLFAWQKEQKKKLAAKTAREGMEP